ncbi:MAG TPA: hypothetical protein VFJ90_05870 [Candidatus Didemnitutus sp.]|nr:hypothetical protein [Candidatus Didemnitutus sp.]
MIPSVRQRYNAAFTGERYAAFVKELNQAAYWPVDFRVAESPLFFDEHTTRELIKAADDIVRQLATREFRHHADRAIPAGLSVPAETKWPHFLCVDFALCADAAGKIVPQLIELQGFPTVACWQLLLTQRYRKHFPAVPEDFTPYFGGLNDDRYLEALRTAVIGDCLAENVVLLDIEPDKQKTRVDFACTHAFLGVRPMCVTKVLKRGRLLFYHSGGREVPIHRIFNRVIFDELLRKNPPMKFSFFEPLEVQWAGHPNWYFRISKHSLPFLKGPYVPDCRFVSELGGNVPSDLENYVCKPLYSFAGLGVDIAPTREKIAAIERPGEWLLQRKVAYAPIMETPDGPAKAEVRLIFAGDGSGMPKLINQLVRLTKGAMHGVDFNKGKTWVGASAGFHPQI